MQAVGPIEYPSLHVWAALLVTVLLALVATELRRFPDAYDRALQLEAGVGGHVSAQEVTPEKSRSAPSTAA